MAQNQVIKLKRDIQWGLLFLLLLTACTPAKVEKTPAQPRGPVINNSWKNISDESLVSFDHHVSEFKIPDEFRFLSDDEQKQVLERCRNTYMETVTQFEDSLADAAVNNVKANATLSMMNFRMLDMFEAEAEMRFDDSTDPAIRHQSKSTFIHSETNRLLVSTAGQCSRTEAGCLGQSAERIQAVFSHGNLRERMFVIYRAGYYLAQFVGNPALGQRLNQYLAKKGWQMMLDSPHSGNPFEYGIYTRLGRVRRSRTLEQLQKYTAEVRGLRLKDSDLKRIPWSEREMEFYRHEGLDSESFDPSLPGAAHFYVPSESGHPFVVNANQALLSHTAGISGSTDFILTVAHYLGLTDSAETKAVIVALLGWMIDSKDHTAHEILASTKSFHFNYVYSPEFHKEFFDHDEEFLKEIDHAQIKSHRKYPADILESCASGALQTHHDIH